MGSAPNSAPLKKIKYIKSTDYLRDYRCSSVFLAHFCQVKKYNVHLFSKNISFSRAFRTSGPSTCLWQTYGCFYSIKIITNPPWKTADSYFLETLSLESKSSQKTEIYQILPYFLVTQPYKVTHGIKNINVSKKWYNDMILYQWYYIFQCLLKVKVKLNYFNFYVIFNLELKLFML
jgi:hypothetical protein